MSLMVLPRGRLLSAASAAELTDAAHAVRGADSSNALSKHSSQTNSSGCTPGRTRPDGDNGTIVRRCSWTQSTRESRAARGTEHGNSGRMRRPRDVTHWPLCSPTVVRCWSVCVCFSCVAVCVCVSVVARRFVSSAVVRRLSQTRGSKQTQTHHAARTITQRTRRTRAKHETCSAAATALRCMLAIERPQQRLPKPTNVRFHGGTERVKHGIKRGQTTE